MTYFQHAAVKRWREDQGLTQQECAASAGMTQSRWADIEAGRVPNPTIETVAAVLVTLDIPDWGELLQMPLTWPPVEPAAKKVKRKKPEVEKETESGTT